MSDALNAALEWFVWCMEGATLSTVFALLPMSLALPALATLVHEAGHALVARRFGVPTRELVAAPEGPAITIRRKQFVLRVGLGLGRDLRSKDPLGWVRLEQPAIPPEQAIAILRAGPAAEAAFGVLLIAVALLPQPRPLRILFAFYGITALASAWASLHARRYPNSDGSQIRRIRENDQRPAPSVPDHAVDDRDARTSVAPPGY